MAKKEDIPKIELEREYNVPLRREWLKVPKYKRAKKASKALKEFMIKHMKSDNIKIGKYANLDIWKRGIKSPPHHIKVNAKKDDKGLVTVELVDAPVEKKDDKKEVEAKKDLKKESKKAEKEIKGELSDLEKKTSETVKEKTKDKSSSSETKK
tara:strand:- start:2153 stop:2611 length:459 start_codon:yes stop_codon:yes gene_type:complete